MIIVSSLNTYFIIINTFFDHLIFVVELLVIIDIVLIITIRYQTRGAAPSNFDINYAYNLGFTATQLVLRGFSGYMASIGNLKEVINSILFLIVIIIIVLSVIIIMASLFLCHD